MSEQLNIERLNNPVAGDYWEERLAGICVVLEVTDTYVIICDKKVENEFFWSFDFNNLRRMTRKEFKEFLGYNTKEGTWGSVHINAQYKEEWIKDYHKHYKNKSYLESKQTQLGLFNEH